MNEDNKIPADQGLQRFSTGINKKYDARVFETLAILDDSALEAETNVALPSESSVAQAKNWVDENRL